jgi:PAS domain S-box-containing protein
MALVPGTRLGAYEIVSQIGVGGMGEVYRARDIKLGRSVAIKVLPEAFASDAERIARLEREAKVLASLNHPHIAALYGFEAVDSRPFLVMEFVEGDTLADRLAPGPLRVEEALRIGIQIAEALEAAHERGIVHRDLKPANVKITPEGEVKLLDFGVAKPATLPVTAISDLPTAVTISGAVLGTVLYMSPEQLLGDGVDTRTDLFSLGIVLYEMATGQRPFTGTTTVAVLNDILNKEPTPPSQLNAAISPQLEGIIVKALEKDKERRYQSALIVKAQCTHVQDLLRLQAGGSELDALFAFSSDLLCVAGFDGYFKRVNPAWEKTIGFTDAELLTRPWINFVHPVDRESTIRAAVDAAASGVVIAHHVNRYVCKHGGYRWLLWSSTPVPERQLFYASARDITERKQAEENTVAKPGIIVLPFESIGTEQELAYCSQALTVELIRDLCQLDGLRVLSRKEVTKGADSTALAKAAGARYTVTGTVSSSGDRLRVIVHLTDAANDEHLWAEKFSSTLQDRAKLQTRIARRVALTVKDKVESKDRM